MTRSQQKPVFWTRRRALRPTDLAPSVPYMVERSPALESLFAEERIALMGRLWDSLDPAAAALVV
ncbi:hypothetical protein [Gemmatimonas sp.]|uniref:hypothetical protein n=1 Tax=Gemmatimonas sp. TaxID=1962908 RepID=UPI003983C2E6